MSTARIVCGLGTAATAAVKHIACQTPCDAEDCLQQKALWLRQPHGNHWKVIG